MSNYQHGKIYKLLDDFNDLLYIGSTCRTLNKRKIDHRSLFKSGNKKRLYEYLRTIQKNIDNCNLILLESYPCESKYDLHKRERHYIDTLHPKCNIQIPTRTKREWDNDNRLRRRIYKRLWERRNKTRRNRERKNRRDFMKLNNNSIS